MEELRERLMELALAGSIDWDVYAGVTSYQLELGNDWYLVISYKGNKLYRVELSDMGANINYMHYIALRNVVLNNDSITFNCRKGLVITYQMKG